VKSRYERSPFIPKLFRQFFTRANASVGDLDIAMWLEAGESNEIFGKIENADRLTHVEDKGFATILHGGSLKDKINRFGDGHEEAIHVGMRNGDGATVGDLVFEFGNNTATAAKDIAKTDNSEGLAGLMSGIKYDHFGKTLGCSINRRRANSFISRDEDEAFDIMSDRNLREVVRAEDIIRDGFNNVDLHERDMFMCGSMENNLRLVLLEYLCKAFLISNIGNDG